MAEPKIAILSPHIPPYYAGSGKRALLQAKYLAGRGYNIVFISVIENSEINKNLEMVTVNLPSAYEVDSLVGAICRNTYHPVLFYKMFKIIVSKKIKLLHCIPAFSWPSFSAVIAAKLLGVKIITETTLEGADDPLTIMKSKVGKLKFFIFKLSDAIINISPLLAERAKEAGIAEQKMFLIPNGVNTDQFIPPTLEKKLELRQQFGLSSFKHVFMYVGVMRQRKGVSDLVEAFRIAKSKIDSCCLVLAGPVDKDDENRKYYGELKRQVETAGIADSVLFTGEVNNIEQWMQACDTFIFASKREGLPNVILEAMSTGLPVIAMRLPQTIDYIFNGNKKSGIIVDTVDELSLAMVELANDEDKRRVISKNARTRITESFSDQVVMEKYIELYQGLLKS